ncbi:MAG: hypothetical protein ACKN9D_17260, partial [Actinomycetales bacterium]
SATFVLVIFIEAPMVKVNVNDTLLHEANFAGSNLTGSTSLPGNPNLAGALWTTGTICPNGQYYSSQMDCLGNTYN